MGKSTECSQNPGVVNEFSATLQGQLNLTGPIANNSDPRCCFSDLFLYFCKVFSGVERSKNLGVLGGFPWLIPKHQGKEDQSRALQCKNCVVHSGTVESLLWNLLWLFASKFSRTPLPWDPSWILLFGSRGGFCCGFFRGIFGGSIFLW